MIEHITDPGDVRIAAYARVGDPSWLAANGLFVAEGRLVVRRALDLSHLRVRSILVAPAALASLGIDHIDPPVFVAPQPVLNAITGFNFHRGCLALVDRPAEGDFGSLLAAERVLAVEGVNNPDNIGGLFRVAAAFGAGGVLLDPVAGDPLYRKAVRTSMGASLGVPFARAIQWPGVLEEFRRAGFTIVAMTPRPEARTLEEFAAGWRRPLVVMVGAEGTGLSVAAMAAADETVRIPISPGVDSLNVVVAAGIALSRLA
jgi:tRNA G18 (ribose-2'-O)-methylase SpoU